MGVIIGSGRALPARIVTNDELSEIVDTTDEWIVPRTGIHTRHVAIEETCTDLGAQAALRRWEKRGRRLAARPGSDRRRQPGHDNLPDTHRRHPLPLRAARIRERIGATNAVCYDMSCACSGCVYGLSTADLIMAGAAFARQEAARTGTPIRCNDVRRVLVVAAERLSKLVDWEERATCILFGDGAGAVVLEWRGEADTEPEPMPPPEPPPRASSPPMEAPTTSTAPSGATVPSHPQGSLRRRRHDRCCRHLRYRCPAPRRCRCGKRPLYAHGRPGGVQVRPAAMMRCTEEALIRAGLATDDVLPVHAAPGQRAHHPPPPRKWANPWSASR